MTIRGRNSLAVSLVTSAAALALLSGCSDDPKKDSVSLDSSPSATESAGANPSASATPTKAPDQDVPKEPLEGQFTRGLDPSTTAEQQAVADVWFQYRAETTRMFSEVTVDDEKWTTLTEGSARESGLSYVKSLKDQKHRNVGGTIGSLESVSVDGPSATVKGCLRSTLIEVNDLGIPQEDLQAYIDITSTLRQEGTSWKVSSTEATVVEKCRFR